VYNLGDTFWGFFAFVMA